MRHFRLAVEDATNKSNVALGAMKEIATRQRGLASIRNDNRIAKQDRLFTL